MATIITSMPTVVSIWFRGSGCLPAGGGCPIAKSGPTCNKFIESNEPINLVRPTDLASQELSFWRIAKTVGLFARSGVQSRVKQQLHSRPMARFFSLRARLVGTVFLAVAPAWGLMYAIAKSAGTEAELPWTILSGFIGLLALAAAWFGGEHFVLRQVRQLYRAARQLAAGDLSSRTGLSPKDGELGELAHT